MIMKIEPIQNGFLVHIGLRTIYVETFDEALQVLKQAYEEYLASLKKEEES